MVGVKRGVACFKRKGKISRRGRMKKERGEEGDTPFCTMLNEFAKVFFSIKLFNLYTYIIQTNQEHTI